MAGRLLLPNEPGWYRVTLAGLLAGLALVVAWNAYSFNHERGYDGPAHIEYANTVAKDWRLPGKEVRGYYNPPLFYVLAGLASRLGEDVLALSPQEKLTQYGNTALLFGAAVLLLLVARLLYPGRRELHVAALAFFCLVPVTTRTAAMFHPEPLDLFLSLAALALASRMLARRSFGWRPAAALGLVLGLAQLSRTFGIYASASVGTVFLLAALWRYAPRRELLRALAVTALAAALVTGPWYVRQAIRYTNPIFDQPTVDKPLWERRPLAFYVDPGMPEVFTDPVRTSYLNRLVPTAYTELWGDYFGIFEWNSTVQGKPDRGQLWDLRAQSVVGLLPTLLALLGMLALLRRAFLRRGIARDPGPALFAAQAVFGLLGFLYFAIGYPTPDGDVIKATFMLAAAPAWALAFGLGLEWLLRRIGEQPLARFYVVAALVAAALLDLRVIVHDSPLGGLF